MTKLWFVEFLTEDPHVPTLSWHVTGTDEEADALRRFLVAQAEADSINEPIVIEVEGSKTISDLITELYNDWGIGNEEEDDDPADQPG